MRTIKTVDKECIRCSVLRPHESDDYMCHMCRFDSDHRFKRDGHTVAFRVGHQGKIGVDVTCPNGNLNEEAPCWLKGYNDWDNCLVQWEMAESGDAMDLITDPYNGEYEIDSNEVPIEWYYHSTRYQDEFDAEFGWRIADGPEQEKLL